MSKTKMKPTATVTLKHGLTLRKGSTKLKRNVPVPISGEATITAFENDNRVVVRRSDDIHRETVASRKKRKSKKTVKPTVEEEDDDEE